ncbi:MAG TPA: aldehyde dehydrogenase family protein [Solirubrobacteraceae bacterium]|nr:aldehyde dehydrogenase family protein [Solirubrobacteraceae bacterium]
MTALNYTSTAGDPKLDEAFERALATAREGRPEPLPHLVGGRFLAAGDVFERADPCDPARVVSRAHTASAEVVADAVAAARAAQPGWAATPLAERVEALRRIAKLIGERAVEMGAIVSAETGKVRLESVPEVQEGVDLIEAYCGHMERNDGYVYELGRLSEDEHNTSLMLPYGVFAVICPFNFPFALAVGMSTGALVTGNTVVMKPAEETPWSTGLIAELAVEAGLPDGVLNLVQGDDATGRALVDAGIDGVAFTGSAEAGHAIARTLHATRPLRPLIVEMGGKNPAIVTNHADLDTAAAGIVRSAYGLAGQKCSSCSRVVVEREVHDELVERIAAGARELVLGDPADPATSLGPVAGSGASERFDAAAADARRDGRIAAGGQRDGTFVQPTLVTGLPRGHRLTREELFLPFLTVTPVDSLDDAIAEANAVEYGLTAGIFSGEDAEVQAFLDRIEAGVVYVNRRAGATTGAWPGIQTFCGWKASGASGKGGLGPHYVMQFMREQSRTIVRG